MCIALYSHDMFFLPHLFPVQSWRAASDSPGQCTGLPSGGGHSRPQHRTDGAPNKKTPKMDKINCECWKICCYMLLTSQKWLFMALLFISGMGTFWMPGWTDTARSFQYQILSNSGHKTHEGNIAKGDAPSDHEDAFVIAHGSSFFIHVVSSLNSAETIRDLMVSHAHKVREYRQSFESFVVGSRPIPRQWRS